MNIDQLERAIQAISDLTAKHTDALAKIEELQTQLKALVTPPPPASSPWRPMTSAPAHRSFIGGIARKNAQGKLLGIVMVPDIAWNNSANAWCHYDIHQDGYIPVSLLTHWMETPPLPDSHS